MDGYKDFTYSKTNFPSLPDIVDDLHANGQHYINIIDPAISDTPGYQPYDDGIANNVFIKGFNSSSPIIGKVWPGT
jgi:lysosomal alpha-glucosidase